ncbi:MAG: tetratricopeptide repeat protein [Candidatus Brocadiia bacterium]
MAEEPESTQQGSTQAPAAEEPQEALTREPGGDEQPGEEPREAAPEPAAPPAGAEDSDYDETEADRHEAITEILAELRGEEEPPGPGEDEDESPGEETFVEISDDAPPEPQGEEQDEPVERADGPPAGAPTPSPAPRQRQAAQASSRPLPLATTSRTLVLLHALFLAVFIVATWSVYRKVADALASVQRPEPPSPLHPPQPRSSLPQDRADQEASQAQSTLQVDEGLRYVQTMEKADVLFEKEQYVKAAAAYRNALAVVPSGWNDGAAAFRLGQCYFRLSKYPQAIAAYRQVALAYPSSYHPRALYQLGEVHLRLGSYHKAREAFYELLLRQASFGPQAASLIEKAHYRLADAYWLEGQALDEEGLR